MRYKFPKKETYKFFLFDVYNFHYRLAAISRSNSLFFVQKLLRLREVRRFICPLHFERSFLVLTSDKHFIIRLLYSTNINVNDLRAYK